MEGEHGDSRLAALREHLARVTHVLDGEREALAATQSFHDMHRVFSLLARTELLGTTLHKRLVEWHSRYPEKPSLAESDSFWADLKELRALKEELGTALEAIRARERTHPTLRGQLEHATNEVGDVEHYFSTYLDRINER
jgi:hypothetical protein